MVDVPAQGAPAEALVAVTEALNRARLLAQADHVGPEGPKETATLRSTPIDAPTVPLQLRWKRSASSTEKQGSVQTRSSSLPPLPAHVDDLGPQWSRHTLVLRSTPADPPTVPLQMKRIPFAPPASSPTSSAPDNGLTASAGPCAGPLLVLPLARAVHSVPFVRGTIAVLYGYPPTDVMAESLETDMVVDTSADMCCMAMELLGDTTIRQLISLYDGSPDLIICSVQVSLRGVNRVFTVPMTLFPRRLMPSNFLGIRLGQQHFLQLMRYQLTPKAVLTLLGRPGPTEIPMEDFYGYLDLDVFAAGKRLDPM